MTWLIGNRIRLQITCLAGKQADCRLQFKKLFHLPSPIPNLLSKKGFSLIELLVVITIIGSLLVISLPHFKNTFNNLRFDNFCQNLISRMRYLQEKASTQQEVYCLNFDLNNRFITTKIKESTSGDLKDMQGLLVKKMLIPENMEVEIVEPDIFFYPDASIGGEDIMISDYQNKATIYINEDIGKVKLEKNEQ